MIPSSSPGAMVLFGSGETAAVGREALRWLRATSRAPRSVAILETPAGFEPNAEAVAARWASFLGRQPEGRGAEFVQVPARRRGTPFSPDDPELARPLLAADLIVLGAGSPTYAVRQLRGSLAWRYADAAHLLGTSFLLASAAAIAVGTCALPVYEIYKVGEDPHWEEGLRLFEHYGLTLAVVPHWDNREGGTALDTSRCYVGRSRFTELLALLPAGVVVVGIGEHTALALHPASASGHVLGRGEATVLRDGTATSFAAGATFSLGALGPFALPSVATIVPAETAQAIRDARSERE
ncbi:MAG: hypothetical protein ACRDF0_06415, partial [Candidatus Limnocylindria bacterium]